MLFATYQPLKNDRRKYFYRNNLKLLYSFCKKPIFAIGYDGDLIGFLSEMLLSSPQQGEKLVIFEAEKYIALNKVHWNKYCKNNFFACVGDAIEGKTALENKIYNVTKKEKGKKTFYEYVVSENDIKKIYEFKLLNDSGEINYILEDSKEYKQLLKKCKKFVHPLEIDHAIYNYNEFAYKIVEYNKKKYDRVDKKKLKKEILKKYPNFSKNNLEEATTREYNKAILYTHKLVFISTLLPYIMVAVLQEKKIFSTGGIFGFIEKMDSIKNEESKFFEMLEPKEAIETKKDVDKVCDQAYIAIYELDKKIRNLFYIKTQKDMELQYKSYVNLESILPQDKN